MPMPSCAAHSADRAFASRQSSAPTSPPPSVGQQMSFSVVQVGWPRLPSGPGVGVEMREGRGNWEVARPP